MQKKRLARKNRLEQSSDWALTPERQGYFSQIIVQAVSEAPKSRDELKAICRKSGMTQAEEGSMFHPRGGGIRELCTRGFMHYSACEEKVLCALPHFEPMPEERAKLELARRYFTNIALATIKDAAYFFATTQTQVKGWLDRLPVTSAECHGKTYYYIENGLSCDADIPECIFLAGFDQLMLGYDKGESLYLSSEDMRKIFNLAGIVMPSVLLHGVVVGRWKLNGKKLRAELFRSLDSRDISIIKRQAAELWSDRVSVEVGI